MLILDKNPAPRGRSLLLIITLLMLTSCGNTSHIKTCERVTLPDPPDVVVMDNGKHDKSKYKHTKWVKKPNVDLKKGRASWSFKDIDTISEALTKWPSWGKHVEGIVGDYNKSVAASLAKEKKSWYKFW